MLSDAGVCAAAAAEVGADAAAADGDAAADAAELSEETVLPDVQMVLRTVAINVVHSEEHRTAAFRCAHRCGMKVG